MKTLELAVRQPLVITLGPQEYTIDFSVKTVAALEDRLGHSMKTAADWFRLETKELPIVLECGLLRHANGPEDAELLALSICEGLNPEGIEELISALCASACPKAVARFHEELEKLKKRGTVPNVQSADAS